MDFTHKTYRNLLQTLLDQGFSFQPFADYLTVPATKVIILRHDVDKRPHYALAMARLEHQMGIRGTYYFRCVPQSWNEAVMRQIATLGHEIGYHYEDLSIARGNQSEAIRHFEAQLKRMRQIYHTKTICMHGSPLSKYDNRDLWSANAASRVVIPSEARDPVEVLPVRKQYDYRTYNIIGEPYFDVDFTRVLYLTDTGRRWDGDHVSVRDKVERSEIPIPKNQSLIGMKSEKRKVKSEESLSALNSQRSALSAQRSALSYRSTNHIIAAANNGTLPDQIMLTIHPQRWTDKPLPWLTELVWQNLKNVVKHILIIAGRYR